MKADAIVLGAGIVGVSAAIHLQKRGRDVVLVDRRGGAGEETSYGNAGLIERASVFPYAFPREIGALIRYAQNTSTDAHYHFSALPQVMPWLGRYFMASSPEGVAKTVSGAWPLIQRSLDEHEALMEAAGATGLLRKVGWIKAFRTPESQDKASAELEKLKPYGLNIDVLDAAGIADREPFLGEGLIGALHYLDPGAISDPGSLVKAYAAYFVSLGGRFAQGDAASLAESSPGWRVDTADGPVQAADVVVALGPWSDLIFKRSTVFKWLSPNDKLATYALDDPEVEGVACHFTVPEKGGYKGWLGLAEEVSDISLACRQTGPIHFKGKLEQGDDMFRQRRSLFFKKMQIVRGCDAKRNVLVYMVYSDRIIEGSPKNSTSSVPIMPWGAETTIAKCGEFFG